MRGLKEKKRREKEEEEEEERKILDENRAKANDAHAQRFSDAGVAASVAGGSEDKVIADHVNCLVPAGSGYDSSTEGSTSLNHYTR